MQRIMQWVNGPLRKKKKGICNVFLNGSRYKNGWNLSEFSNGKKAKGFPSISFHTWKSFCFLLRTLVPSIRGLLVLSQHFLLKILGYAH